MANKQSARLKALGINAVLNIAHRGARAFAPENTLAAFAKAKLFGCQMFELDVRFSKDRELMVHHDESLMRCTDVQLKFPALSHYDFADFTVAQLSQLDAGSWYTQQLLLPANQRQAFMQTLAAEEIAPFISAEDIAYYQSGVVKIPTLKQALELAQAMQMLVNIELKTKQAFDTTLADAVVKLVKALDMEQRVLISAFEHEQLRRVRQLNATIAIGVLTNQALQNPSSYCHALDADAYHPNGYREDPVTGGRILDVTGFSAVRQNGQGVNVWTCNRQTDMY
ncbi:MAG: glycerophosphodiester phosphodiesterase, partial [Methylococcaceae bacterium]|nr:glycerophosphodiester phosphodiesterase [Methylococcaceae bacterium]